MIFRILMAVVVAQAIRDHFRGRKLMYERMFSFDSSDGSARWIGEEKTKYLEDR